MDLVDRIETTRFLGGEFMLWLWFSRDVLDGLLEMPGFASVELQLESELQLVDPLAEKERVHIRGADPLGSREAEHALLLGKLPRKVGLRLRFEQSEWLATLDAASLALSGVKLPELLSEGEEEHFHERMRLLEQLHDLIQGLYRHFLQVRLSAAWQSGVLPAMRRWLGGELLEPKAYAALHDTGSQRRRKAR